MRLRLIDFRLSRGPQALGICQSDINACARIVNAAQERLIYAKEASDESWQNTWAEIAFNVSRATPYITLPRGIARLEMMDVCNRPVPLNNQFFEYLQFGNGRFPKTIPWCNWPRITQGFARNNAVTFTDLSNPPQTIQVFASAVDVAANKRVLIQGLDANSQTVYSQDGTSNVQGIFVPLASPFAVTPMTFSYLTGIQKDVTLEPVQFFQLDPVTGATVLLLTMEPGETTASYRRYYIDHLPCSCCPQAPFIPPGMVQVTAIAKLDLIPVVYDTDYLTIPNLEALIAEGQSVRYSEMDSATSIQKAAERHTAAIRLLIAELSHFQGKNAPATNFAPFGTARLERVNIGMI